MSHKRKSDTIKLHEETRETNKGSAASRVVAYSDSLLNENGIKAAWKHYFSVDNGVIHPHLTIQNGRDMIPNLTTHLPPPHDNNRSTMHSASDDEFLINRHKRTAAALQRVDSFIEKMGAGSMAEAMEQIVSNVDDEDSRNLAQLYTWASVMFQDAGHLVELWSYPHVNPNVEEVIKTLQSIPPRFQSFVNISELLINYCTEEHKKALEFAKQAVRAYATATHLILDHNTDNLGMGRKVMYALIDAIERLDAISERCPN